MTFLEYVCERLMGPPISRSGGRSIWPCPECDDQTAFGTLPHNPKYKDRVHCHRCGFRGDEADMIRFYHPRENWPTRSARISAWFAEYRDQSAEIESAANSSGDRGHSSPRDRHDELAAYSPDGIATIQAIDAYLDTQPLGLADRWRVYDIVLQAARIGMANGLSFGAFLERLSYEVWTREQRHDHLKQCTDPHCDAVVCRVARGLSPLTTDELERGRLERIEKERVEAESSRERVRRAMKGGHRNGRAGHA